MNSRERVRAALSHEEPDRVPMDLGGTAVSTIRLPAYRRLCKFLELYLAEPDMISAAFGTVDLADPVRARLRVDLVGLRPRPPVGWKDRFLSADSFVDEWGVRHSRSGAAGDLFIPSGHPLAGADLETIRRYPLPDLADRSRVEGLEALAQRLFQETGYALVADGMWSLLQRAYDLRGMASFLMDMARDEMAARTLLERLTESTVTQVRLFLQAVGDYVEVVTVADDLGLQSGPVMSPAMYRRLLQPCHRAIIAEIRAHTTARIMLHSDGAILPFIEDLVDVGFEVLNPVQVSARDMDPLVLKRRFGDTLSFWGGVDTQQILPRGSPSDVEAEVRRNVDQLAEGGGYILGAVHVIQDDVPPENVWALFDSGFRHGQYQPETQLM